MLKAKKGHMMRHPYLSLTILGLATVGAIGITNRVKGFFKEKTNAITNMVTGMKQEQENS